MLAGADIRMYDITDLSIRVYIHAKRNINLT